MDKNFPRLYSLKEHLLRFRMWIGALLLRREYEINPALQEFKTLDMEDFHN